MAHGHRRTQRRRDRAHRCAGVCSVSAAAPQATRRSEDTSWVASPAQPKLEASPMGQRADRGSGTSLSKALLERFSMEAVFWGSLPEGKVSRQSSKKPSGGCWEHHGGRVSTTDCHWLCEEPEAWCAGQRHRVAAQFHPRLQFSSWKPCLAPPVSASRMGRPAPRVSPCQGQRRSMENPTT